MLHSANNWKSCWKLFQLYLLSFFFSFSIMSPSMMSYKLHLSTERKVWWPSRAEIYKVNVMYLDRLTRDVVMSSIHNRIPWSYIMLTYWFLRTSNRCYEDVKWLVNWIFLYRNRVYCMYGCPLFLAPDSYTTFHLVLHSKLLGMILFNCLN